MATMTMISSDGKTLYDIGRTPAGALTCTCRGFEFRRTCRHVVEVQAATAPTQLERDLLAAALRYHDLGYHVIPIEPGGKRPLVSWKAIQTKQPTVKQIHTWWTRTPTANVGIVITRGMVVDLDGGLDAETLLVGAGITLPAEAPMSQTASGFHIFLGAKTRQPDRIGLLRGEAPREDGSVTPKGKARTPQVDVRGLGVIILPPSVHPSGARYEWLTPLVHPLPPAPAELLSLVNGAA